MKVDGRAVSRTTGRDIEEIKGRLYRTYFHIPEPTTKKPRRKR